MYYTSKEVYKHISKQTNDPIVERKICEVSGQEFPIFQSDLEFYDKISPTFNGKKYQIPTPKLCPEERERRRMSWRNERKLFKRTCDATGEDIISMYPADTKFPVYAAKIWRGDSWNAMKYGFSIDETKTFGQQFQSLLNSVPLLYMYNINAQNSDYSNCSLDMKDCYLVSGAIGDENCLYGNYMDYCKHCVDNIMVFNSENCYECIDCNTCYNCHYCQNTKNTKKSYFLYNCDNCEDCFCSVNLINKKYCYFNQQLTKQQYKEKLSKINFGSYNTIQNIRVEYNKFLNKFPRLATIGYNNDNCFGNNPLSNSKNCVKCFDASDLEDCKYLYWFRKAKNCYDVFSFGSPSEMLYECVAIGSGSNHCIASTNIETCSYCYYSIQCGHSHHLFACNGLKNTQYCIFNKQYTKKDWHKQVANIVDSMIKDGSWGEMLNQNMSVYSYNYSVAQEFMPLKEKEAKKIGYNRYDDKIDAFKTEKEHSQFINNIENVDDQIVTKIFKCKTTNKSFRITHQELDFYRKNNIPLPQIHPDQRYKNRLKQRPARELHLRNCDKCGKEMVSVYDRNFEGKVYCEECYQKEIYG